jgi:diguanylate cyclase (GGDEF)-like protein/PAS domain S-box-containing protein
VLERITDGVFSLDRDWRYRFVNPAGARLLGRTPEDLLGRSIWEVFPKAVGTVFERRYREALENQQVIMFEEWFEPLQRWYSIRVFPSVNGLTVYYRDMTERRRHLHELAERARQQGSLAALSHRCLTATGLDEMLTDAAGTVAETLDVPLVEILGRPLGHASVVVATATHVPSYDADATTAAIRVAIPGANPSATELVIHMDERRDLEEDARDFVSAVVALVSSGARQIQNTREAQYQALHDPLTGLPNRRMLLGHLRDAIAGSRRNPSPPAVLAVSVDRLWLITSSYGHSVGDELVVALGERIQRVVEPNALLARMGGDLFVLVIDQPTGDMEPTKVAGRLHAAMREPLRAGSGEHFMAVSIGIAHATRNSQPETVLRDADTALKRARAPLRTAVFDESARREVLRATVLDRELHLALERNELVVYYQPIIDLTTERPTGVEALVRWMHPEQGIVPPTEFISAAEDNGLIIPIGAWVLEQACQQTAVWQRQLGGPLQVSVNVSARQLADPGFARFAADVAARAGLLPRTLELEITESLLMEEAGSPRSRLAELRELGIRLALDDFGAGYSSLSYLRSLAVDTLKIDRSFVSDLRPGKDAAIVEAVIKMAHAIEMTVVAEGVERADQQVLLWSLGCDRLQGYLYSRPVPAEELRKFLERPAHPID